MKRWMIPFLLAEVVMTGMPEFSRAAEIIGHRGASRDAPENTLASINLAWKRNADAVEIDVYLSKDGHIVVVHDETTKRYGGPDRKIADQTLAELKKLDVGRWKDEKWTGERIPTLADVLETIPEGKRLFIEIKCGSEIVPELKRVIRASGKKPKQTAVGCFDLKVVTAVKNEMPDLNVFLVVGLKQNIITRRWSPKANKLITKVKAANLDGLDIGRTKGINKKFAREIKQAGLGLYVWTINDPKEAKRLISLGIDGITTDRPGWLRAELEAGSK